jgi:hypothetical protein
MAVYFVARMSAATSGRMSKRHSEWLMFAPDVAPLIRATGAAWLETAFSLSPNRRNRVNLPKSGRAPPSLDFPGVVAMFHATFGKSELPNA